MRMVVSPAIAKLPKLPAVPHWVTAIFPGSPPAFSWYQAKPSPQPSVAIIADFAGTVGICMIPNMVKALSPLSPRSLSKFMISSVPSKSILVWKLVAFSEIIGCLSPAACTALLSLGEWSVHSLALELPTRPWSALNQRFKSAKTPPGAS